MSVNRNAWIIVVLSVLAVFVFVACVFDHKQPPQLPARRLVGYFAAWSIHRGYHVTDIPAGMLTHVVYAFDAISPGGDCISDTISEGANNFPALMALKQQHPQLKTLISVGGASLSTNFPIVAAVAVSRTHFAESCVQFMKRYGFDGIDIDWEFPSKTDKPNFTALLAELRSTLDAQGNADGAHYLLTIAAPAGPGNYSNIELNLIHPYLDWINLMTYGFALERTLTTTFQSPLFPSPSDPSPRRLVNNADAAVSAYIAAGVPADKIVMGVPLYGRGWQGVAAANNGLYQHDAGPSTGTWAHDGVFSQQDLESNYVVSYTRFFQGEAMVPWLYNPAAQVFITYEDQQSLGIKADYVVSRTLGGMMAWELSMDDAAHSLIGTLNTHLHIHP